MGRSGIEGSEMAALGGQARPQQPPEGWAPRSGDEVVIREDEAERCVLRCQGDEWTAVRSKKDSVIRCWTNCVLLVYSLVNGVVQGNPKESGRGFVACLKPDR